jgi:hypothetical protein
MNKFYSLLTRRLLPVLVLAATSQRVLAQAPATQWDRRFGGTTDDRMSAAWPTTDGGFLLSGSSQSAAGGDKTQASRGNYDYWVVKVDASGAKVWDKTFGGSGEDRLLSARQTADGGYILGGYSTSGVSGDKTQGTRGGQDYWLVKLDAAGTKVWDKTFGGGGDDRFSSLEQTADGGYILAGASFSGISGEKSQDTQGGFDYWIVKVDATGTKMWDKDLGGDSNDVLSGVQQTADGGYILGGYSYSGVTGDKTQPNAPGPEYDYWVVKVNAAGAKVWDSAFGGTGPDNLTSVQQTADGGYLVGGFSNSPISATKSQNPQGNFDFWVVKINRNGTRRWDRSFGGSDYDQLNSLHQTTDGGFLLGGFSQSPPSGDKTGLNYGAAGSADFWVVKTDSLGTKQWDQSYGGSQSDQLTTLRQAPDGSVILGGFSDSGISGTKTQASQGTADFWAVRLGRLPTATLAGAALPALAVYPNPARAAFTLTLPAAAPRNGLQLRLLDATGRQVWVQALPANSAPEHPVEVGAHPAGLYLLRLEGTAGYVAAQRLLLEE